MLTKENEGDTVLAKAETYLICLDVHLVMYMYLNTNTVNDFSVFILK